MRIPKVKKRRHYDRRPSGALRDYFESDDNYIQNNFRAVMWFLKNRDKLNFLINGVPYTPPKEYID